MAFVTRPEPSLGSQPSSTRPGIRREAEIAKRAINIVG